MGLTTDSHVWMFPAWYRPNWYQRDYILPNKTLPCTEEEVCWYVLYMYVFSIIPEFLSTLFGLPNYSLL